MIVNEAREDCVTPSAKRTYRVRVLLLVPFAAVVWPPLYNHAEPALVGVPFFYWYQMVWVVMTGGILWLVYWCERRNGP
jgi:hypothetical protein